MWSRVVCIEECRINSVLRSTPEIFFVGEVFDTKLKREH